MNEPRDETTERTDDVSPALTVRVGSAYFDTFVFGLAAPKFFPGSADGISDGPDLLAHEDNHHQQNNEQNLTSTRHREHNGTLPQVDTSRVTRASMVLMDILLIRHGDAVEDAPGLGDGGRWLTDKGRRITRQVALWLAEQKHHRPVEIWTSPLVRAVQTAEIIAAAVELQEPVAVLADLSPNGHLPEVLRALARFEGEGPVALVGHEPSLSTLAVTLLGPSVRWTGFKKSGVLGVRWKARSQGTFWFALDPKTLDVVTDPRRVT